MALLYTTSALSVTGQTTPAVIQLVLEPLGRHWRRMLAIFFSLASSSPNAFGRSPASGGVAPSV
ncbi:MAG: hypothetical protein FWD69_19995 [Polyangiaceae bacterium]|nr:hypothetical protein [Polyangiaceae bacterium]